MLPLRDLRPGDTLGRYEILVPIARGGMAAVWAARLTGSRGFTKVVAIKTMLPGLTDDPDFEAMFLDEARLAARIKHPHVAEIIDLGDEDELIYIVMEWVNGETMFTLNKRAKQKGGLPMPLMLRIASSACAGLHAAHELRDAQGNLLDLVHRDISPQNIMISFDGIVKIVDFGVAKAAGRAHETRVAGIMKGKVPYLSPEQLSGGKVDRRSDIFSLGVLMYVMVSGRHPFRGDSDARTMENICSRAPVPLRELVPNVRSDLEAVVMRALEKTPATRWPDCAQMQRALDQVLASIGAAVTDGDVAQFVRAAMGDLIEERNRTLEAAIQQMDARVMTSDRPVPARTTLSAKRAVRGGAPLPATFEGILPVALEDEGPYEPPRRDPPPLSLAPRTQAVSIPPPVVQPPPPRRRSRSPWLVIGLGVMVGAFAVGVVLGGFPWVTERLPPWLSGVTPDSSSPTAPAPSSAPAPGSVKTSAPTTSAAAPSPPPQTVAPSPPPAPAPQAPPTSTPAPTATGKSTSGSAAPAPTAPPRRHPTATPAPGTGAPTAAPFTPDGL